MIIKRINEGQDGIAEWHYDFFEAGMGSISIFDPKNQVKKRNRINILISILSILAKYDLFAIEKIKIDDLQFLIDKDGSMVIADPLHIHPDKPSNKNIRMIDLLIEKARANGRKNN